MSVSRCGWRCAVSAAAGYSWPRRSVGTTGRPRWSPRWSPGAAGRRCWPPRPSTARSMVHPHTPPRRGRSARWPIPRSTASTTSPTAPGCGQVSSASARCGRLDPVDQAMTDVLIVGAGSAGSIAGRTAFGRPVLPCHGAGGRTRRRRRRCGLTADALHAAHRRRQPGRPALPNHADREPAPRRRHRPRHLRRRLRCGQRRLLLPAAARRLRAAARLVVGGGRRALSATVDSP